MEALSLNGKKWLGGFLYLLLSFAWVFPAPAQDCDIQIVELYEGPNPSPLDSLHLCLSGGSSLYFRPQLNGEADDGFNVSLVDGQNNEIPNALIYDFLWNDFTFDFALLPYGNLRLITQIQTNTCPNATHVLPITVKPAPLSDLINVEDEYCNNEGNVPLSASFPTDWYFQQPNHDYSMIPNVFSNSLPIQWEGGDYYLNTGMVTTLIADTIDFSIKYYNDYFHNDYCALEHRHGVTVKPAPIVDFTKQGECEGDSLVFINTSIIVNSQGTPQDADFDAVSGFQWTTPSEEITDASFFDTLIIADPLPGNYDISLSMEHNGCGAGKDISFFYGGVPTGEISIDSPDCGSGLYLTWTLTNELAANNRPSSIEWHFGDGDTSSELFGLDNDTSQVQQHTFPAPGTYDISVEVSTSEGCVYTTQRKVVVVSSHNPTAGTPFYREDFNSGDGGWFALAKHFNDVSAWERGIPNNIPDIDTTGEHGGFWYIGLVPDPDGGSEVVYPPNEDSWVYSPCFDITDLERPMLSLDIWYETKETLDGAAIEYYDNDSMAWRVLGEKDRGLDWYNSFVISSPGEQELLPTGWSGKSDGWRSARYKLDHIKHSSSASQFRFRVAFASDGELSGTYHHGFAFDNVCIGEREKMVLVEHFVNGYDDGMDDTREGLYTLLSVNGQVAPAYQEQVPQEFNTKDVLSIEYHTDFYNEDVLNEVNPTDPSARVLYYGINSLIPQAIVQGVNSLYTPNLNQLDLERVMLETPVMDVSIDDFNAATQTTIRVEPREGFSTDDDVVLYLVLVEFGVTIPENPDTEYEAVLRKMIPDAGGTLLDGNLQLQNTFTDILEGVSYDNLDSLEIVVFVQNKVTKEVYNAATSRDVSAYPYVFTDDGPDTAPLIKVFPNPTTGTLNLSLEGAVFNMAEWAVFGIGGRRLLGGLLPQGESNARVSLNNLPNGTYLLHIVDGMGLSYHARVLLLR